MGRFDLPRISIVTPSLNQGSFLEECIDSVLTQGYPNLEYVIMDGGSTDGSIEVIKRYEKHLAYWQTQPDGGQYAAINAGFSRTSGEIMAWLNSDDKYPPWALLKVGWLFAKNPQVQWLTGRPLVWSREGEAEFVYVNPISHAASRYLEGGFDDPYIQQESTFWRRDLWEQAGGRLNTDLRLAADLELWVRFFRSAPLYLVNSLLGGFRQHGAQKSVLMRDEYVEECLAVLAAERERAQGLPSPPPAPEALFIDATEFREFSRSIGRGQPDPSGIEHLLLQTAIAASASGSAFEAAERHRMILKLDHALTLERQRSEWLYSSAAWRLGRSIYKFFRSARSS